MRCPARLCLVRLIKASISLFENAILKTISGHKHRPHKNRRPDGRLDKILDRAFRNTRTEFQFGLMSGITIGCDEGVV